MSARHPSPPLPASFSVLYAEHYGFMWRCARRIGVAACEVEDVVQDSFVIALRRYEEFDHAEPGEVSSWLFAILRNVARNRGRSERRRQARLDTYATRPRVEFTPPESGAEAKLARSLLDEFLATLDEDKRAAFVLAELEGMTGPELAGAIGLNLNTANSRLRAARKAFRRHFDEPRATLGVLRRCARRERPERGARARCLPAIALAAGYEPGATAVGSVGAALLANKLVATIVGVATVATVVGVVGVAVVGAGVVAAPHASAPPTSTGLASTAPRSSPPPVAESDSPTQVDPGPGSDVHVPREPERATEAKRHDPDAPAHAPATTRSGPTKPAPNALAQLGKARQALRAGDPARTLALVTELEVDPSLDGRRVALEVEANCALGRVVLARELAASWRAKHPSDPVAALLADVCSE